MFIFLGIPGAQAQQSLHISGTVISNFNQNEIKNVSVTVAPATGTDSTNIGTATNRDGQFDLFFNHKLPYKLVFNHVAYYKTEITIEEREATDLEIELIPRVIESDEVVVTSDIISKEELENPVTVDRVSTVDVEQLASFSVFDLVSTLREVDVATQSMTMQSVNTRGFNASANKRFLQLTDGVDNRAPGLSFPIGNLMGLPEVDVSSVELLPGPASAEYGSSALNGVLLTNSKDPFVHRGITIKTKTGVNDFQLSGREFFSASGNGMYDFSGRFAKAFWDKLAIKLTAEISGGTDWKAENYDNIGAGDIHVDPGDHPGYNGVNKYGDETYAYLPVGSEDIDKALGEFVQVARTGYQETALVDYDIATQKLAGALHYKFSENSRIVTEGRYGFTNALYTGDTRVRLEGFKMYQGKVNLTLNNFNLTGYSTWQNSGQSYDVSILADNLVSSAKSDQDWYRDFRIAYQNGLPVYGVSPNDYADARRFADSGTTLLRSSEAVPRYNPGTDRFRQKVNEIKSSTDYENGAAIRDNSRLYHVQSSYSMPDLIPQSDFQFGGNFRFFDINSQGTIFPDTTGNDITTYEFGGFASVSSQLFNERLNSRLSLRFDKKERFETRITPSLGLNYSLNDKNYFRFSFQNGFRYPGVREQFINKNLGNARLVGGLPQVVSQYDLPDNAITTRAIERFNDAVATEMNENLESPAPYNRNQAELQSLPILEEGILDEDAFSELETETATTLEAGYKRLFSKNFYLDLNYYVSFYNNFIGITRVVKPRTSPRLNLYDASSQVNNSTESNTYYVYSNAAGQLMVHGASFKLDYLSGGFLLGLNGTWTNLIKNSDDPIVPGFNTPPFKLNFEWGHREITEYVGFKMVYRFRTQYDWRSPFVDGTIDSYGHFDVQFNVEVPSVAGNLKFGVTNLGVEQYYNIYGGPSIGSIIFASFTFDPQIF